MYILGAYPEWYWIFYLLKSLFLVFYKLLFFWYPKKQHYFFLDFCWITNGGFFFLFIGERTMCPTCMHHAHTPPD